MPHFLPLGKFVAAHGLHGELILEHSLGKKTALKGLTALFVEDRKESFLPWFITAAKAKSETEICLQLEGIDTREEAQQLAGKKVWLREEEFSRYAAKSTPVNLLGYQIIDGKKPLGEILEIIEQPHQLLCRLEIDKKEVLIPLHEDSLKRIDHAKKQVLVSLPEGLLDVYLS